MQIKRETDYAIRCVFYLCGLQGDDIAMADEISSAMDIPKSFTAKILQKLTRAGIVTSFQGVKGGFKISKEPDQISLLDVIVVIEGPLALNVCIDNEKACGLSRKCKVHPFWFKIRSGVENVFRDLTFDQFLK
jgi:Rrf2 family protein